jgi:hypothetical protein
MAQSVSEACINTAHMILMTPPFNPFLCSPKEIQDADEMQPNNSIDSKCHRFNGCDHQNGC